MNRYKYMQLFSSALGISLSVVLANAITKWIEAQDYSSWIVIIASIFIVVVFGQLFRILLEEMFERSRWLRRLWLGDQFIEGIWFDVLLSSGSPISYGVLVIRGDGAGVRIGGQDYDHNGTHLGSFQSNSVIIAWPTILYVYTAHRRGIQNPINIGLEQIRFEESKSGPPVHHTAVAMDVFTGSNIETEAWKITEKEIELKLNDPVTRSETIKQLISDYWGHLHSSVK